MAQTTTTIPDSDASSPVSSSTSPTAEAPSPAAALSHTQVRDFVALPKRELLGTAAAGADGDVEVEKEPPTMKEQAIQRLKERKMTATMARNEHLRREITAVREKLEGARTELRSKDAAATVKAHIKLLHRYNEMRDIGQGLMGLIAEQRCVAVREVYDDFGVGRED